MRRPIVEVFAENLQLLLDENNISQSQLARELGSTFQVVTRWFHGRMLPEAHTIDRIAEFFDVPTSFLFIDKLAENEEIKPKPVDITGNYIALYRRLFGINTRVPNEVIMITNMVATEVLMPRDWYMLTRRYNLDGYGIAKFVELAKEFDISKQRVSQIVAHAERILRGSADMFLDYESEMKYNKA